MVELEKPSPELWNETVKNHKRFAVSDLKQIEEDWFATVLQNARLRAGKTGEAVRIAALYQGKWYLMDTAYPTDYLE
jgi:hypothetical protein